VDYLFVFTQPSPGFWGFRAEGIALGYLLFAATFAAFGWYRSLAEAESGNGRDVNE
jgi:hypothetical protein